MPITQGFYSVLILLLLAQPIYSAAFDLTQTNKDGAVMNLDVCNKDTVIDFSFSPSSTISCDTTACTLTNAEQSYVKFLDVGGSEQMYWLQSNGTSVEGVTGTKSRPQENGLIRLRFRAQSGRILNIGIPFSQSISSTTSPQVYELDLNKVDDGAFANIKSATGINSAPLSSLNFLNKRDFGHFYHIADSTSPTSQTYLLGYFVLSNTKINIAGLPQVSYNFPRDGFIKTDTYATTGDKLCWGSNSDGIFQTHLRQSYPLWASWIGILFYWLYILLSEANEINCYDKRFENNKWTCWGFYSLHFLGHEEYFTKLSRTTLMLITFSWEGCVLAILFYQIPAGQGPIMILWAALIAVGTAMPFYFFMGGIFMRKIYELTLHKYDTLKQIKGVFNKKDPKIEALEKSIDDTEESLYGYYYWFYVFAFCFFTAFWIIAVQQMMQMPRENYYLMHHWLAALGVALGFEHLFFDPLFTLILGNTSFYRIRGFFYNFKLGERFKEIQQ